MIGRVAIGCVGVALAHGCGGPGRAVGEGGAPAGSTTVGGAPTTSATADDWAQPLPAGVAWQVVVAGERQGPDGSFDLTIEAPAPVPPGADARFRLVVEPGEGYKINVCEPGADDCSDYPVKLSLAPPDGVAAGKTELARDEVVEHIDAHRLVVAFAVTPTAAGDYEIPARLKFAVCEADACLPKRVDLRAPLAAR